MTSGLPENVRRDRQREEIPAIPDPIMIPYDPVPGEQVGFSMLIVFACLADLLGACVAWAGWDIMAPIVMAATRDDPAAAMGEFLLGCMASVVMLLFGFLACSTFADFFVDN